MDAEPVGQGESPPTAGQRADPRAPRPLVLLPVRWTEALPRALVGHADSPG